MLRISSMTGDMKIAHAARVAKALRDFKLWYGRSFSKRARLDIACL